MKNITPRAFLVGAALLSAGTFATLSPAQAQTRRDVRDARRDVRDAQRDLRREQTQYRNRNRRPVAPIRRRGTYRYTGRTYNGRVTSVHSSQSFDINIGGNTYNVYTVSRLPLGLSRGDLVRVTGDQMYSNDIRNARAYVVRNG